MNTNSNRFYENKIIILFFLTWGFLFVDRLAIAFIFPVIVPDLNLTNTQVGLISTVFSIAWALSAILFGGIADKFGNLKKWLLLSGFLTAIFGGLCSLAYSFETLIFLRILVGAAEGPFAAFVMASLGKSVNAERLGIAVGIVNSGVSVIAMTLGPIFITQLVGMTSWQGTFLVAAIPGFLLMLLVWKMFKPVPDAVKETTDSEGRTVPKKNMYAELLSYKNFRICCILGVTHMAAYFVLQTFSAIYWTTMAGISVQASGFLISAAGLVGIVQAIALPKISDIVGRKPVLIITYALAITCPLCMYIFPGTVLTMVVYVAFSLLAGALGVFWMNMIPMETLPPYLTASGISIPMALGELIGGAGGTVFAGIIADKFGLAPMMLIAVAGLLVSLLLAAMLTETAPRALAKKRNSSVASD